MESFRSDFFKIDIFWFILILFVFKFESRVSIPTKLSLTNQTSTSFGTSSGTTTTTVCPTYKCLYPDGNTICVRPDQLCNFKSDCKDGSDERNCGNCNFDDWLTCGWNVDETQYRMKVILPATRAPDNLPHVDGNNSSKGGYLTVYDHKSFNESIHSITFTSPLINARTLPSCKFQFDYFASKGVNIKLKIVHQMMFYYLTDFDNYGSDWSLQTVEIGQQEPGFNIQIMADPKESVNGWETFALDNIYLVDCDSNHISTPGSTTRTTDSTTTTQTTSTLGLSTRATDSTTTHQSTSTLGPTTRATHSTTTTQSTSTLGPTTRATHSTTTTQSTSTLGPTATATHSTTTHQPTSTPGSTTRTTDSTTTAQPDHLNSKHPKDTKKIAGIISVSIFLLIGFILVGYFVVDHRKQQPHVSHPRITWMNNIKSDI